MLVIGITTAMTAFTVIMCIDIFQFGKKMADISGPLGLFATPGRVVSWAFCALLVIGWIAVGWFACSWL